MRLHKRKTPDTTLSPEEYGDRVFEYLLPRFKEVIRHEAARTAEESLAPVVDMLAVWQYRPFTADEIARMRLDVKQTTERLEQLLQRAEDDAE